MFPGLAARETYFAGTKFAFRKQKMFLPEVKKKIHFPHTNFVSETYVSQFSHHENKTMLARFQCCSLKLFPSKSE